jgi:hypothetical protein
MVTSDMAARRKYLESLGHTGRTDPELDGLNRALTDSCSTTSSGSGRPSVRLRASQPDRSTRRSASAGRNWAGDIGSDLRLELEAA